MQFGKLKPLTASLLVRAFTATNAFFPTTTTTTNFARFASSTSFPANPNFKNNKTKMPAKAHTALDEMDEKGSFKRTAAGFRNTIEEGGRFPPEADRYHLYVSLACPWACGTLAALKYKGLDDVIGHSIVHSTWRRTRPDDPEDKHIGWHFRSPGDDPVTNDLGYGSNDCDDALVPDTVYGFKTIRDLYEKAEDKTGKYSTPVLWDKKEGTIVCNESLDILKIFDSAFDGTSLLKHPENKLFPSVPGEAEEAEGLNEWIYPTVNNGVYRCGFAKLQGAYSKAHEELFSSLERLEEHLKKFDSERGFLTSDNFTWIDLRLYMTLVRFDPVYVVYFKTSHKRIADHPHILEYMRRCYKVPAVKAVTNIKHIKQHYFTSHPALNTYGIIPDHNGPDLE